MPFSKNPLVIYLVSLWFLSGVSWSIGIVNGQHAWKPLATSTAALSSGSAKRFTSSYSFQQTHPEYGFGSDSSSAEFALLSNEGAGISSSSSSDEYVSKELIHPIPDQILTVKSPFTASNEASLTAVQQHSTIARPNAINFNDGRFGYKGSSFKGLKVSRILL